jgi:hypothetical protein
MPRSRLTADQLLGLNSEADELLQKLQVIETGLQRITNLCENLPNEDALSDLGDSVRGIAGVLGAIPELCEALPNADEFEDLKSVTAAIAANLSAATE